MSRTWQGEVQISCITMNSLDLSAPQHTVHGTRCTKVCYSKRRLLFVPSITSPSLTTTKSHFSPTKSQSAIAQTTIPKTPTARTNHADTSISAQHATNSIQSTDATTEIASPNKSHNNLKPNQPTPKTPVLTSRLLHYLQDYDPHLRRYIINGFKYGFRLHAENNIKTQATKNSAIANKHPEAVSQKLAKELAKGNIAGPFKTSPFADFQISPLSLRQKNDGSGWRLLHDLSYPYDDTSVNQSIPEDFKHVTYSSVHDAINIIQRIGKGSYMAKADIASAFTLVPIHPDYHNLLGFKWQGNYYHHTTLPQGAGSSCFIFERIATAIQWILQHKFAVRHMVHYLDDFLFIGSTSNTVKHYLQSFINLCADIGIPINHSKTEGPATSLIFLGISLDSESFTASLPMEKVSRYSDLMHSFLVRKTCTLHELQQVIGSLQFTTSVVRPGRTFLRRLINATIGISKPYHHVHLTKEVKEDIRLWLSFLQTYNGISFFINNTPITSEQINLYTDSCPQGFGGTFKNHYFLGQFPPTWQQFNICVLELYPILLALQLYASHMANSHIVIYSDNIAVVHVLNKKTTKQTQMLTLLRQLVLHCLKFNILFTSKHISGKLNILPDALSRSIHTSQMLQEQRMNPEPTKIPGSLLPMSYNL